MLTLTVNLGLWKEKNEPWIEKEKITNFEDYGASSLQFDEAFRRFRAMGWNSRRLTLPEAIFPLAK